MQEESQQQSQTEQQPQPKLSEQAQRKSTGEWFKTSIFAKIVSIGILILVLAIPTVQIRFLVHERQDRRNTAVKETNLQWGTAQNLKGPMLTIPYKIYSTKIETVEEEQVERQTVSMEKVHFLPNTLNMSGNVDTQARKRGIYELIIYSTKIGLSGEFKPDFESLSINKNDVLWDKAVLSFDVSDVTGIRDKIGITLDGKKLVFEPNNFSEGSAVGVITALDPGKSAYAFDMAVDLNGSEQLSFTPIGKETSVSLTSNWTSPSFNGTFIPKDRELNDKGFSAQWNILNFNRNFPQQWTGAEDRMNSKISDSQFGVEFYQSVDKYQRTERSIKYCLLFIMLTFLVFFFVEILNKKKKFLHPVQYLLVGFAISLFYLLLLSLSEHLAFGVAYLIASIATIGVITGYTRSVFRSGKITILMAGLLIAIYVFLYVALNLEDYALLVASVALFIILAIIMYISRNVDWYSITKKESN